MIPRLIDSVILIDHLNGIGQATNFILELDPLQTAISVITRAEILAGLSKEEIALAMPLLDQYQLFIIDKPIADLAANYGEKPAGSFLMHFRLPWRNTTKPC